MLQCWKEKPDDRPSFHQLLDILKSLISSSSSLPSFPILEPPRKEMDVEGVCEWLKTLKLTKDYSELIRSNGIDGVALQYMTEEKWKDVGVTAIGDLVKIVPQNK